MADPIDTAKLRELLAAAFHQPPWIVYPPTDPWGGGIGARSTKYNIGGFEFNDDTALAVAAVNALPALIAVYEAACAWRDDRAQIEEALLTRDRGAADRLAAAVDAARPAP
jgi:hypothetical protein